MATVHGVVANGKIVADAPPDWPDGTAVVVDRADEHAGIGMREEDWDDSPEGIEAWCRRLASHEPVMTEEEEAEWKKNLAEQKTWELAHREEYNHKLDKLFE